MATHLYPGVRSNFSSKFKRSSFKPQLFTHEYQRPSDGEGIPGQYGKEPESVHLKGKKPPEVRGSCSTSCASNRTKGVPVPRSPGRNSPGRSSPGRKASAEPASGGDKDQLKSSTTLSKMAMHFDKKAASEDQRAKDVLERDLYTKLSIALHKYLASNQGEELDIIVRRWDRQGQGKLSSNEFRVAMKTPPPNGLGVEHDHKEIDAFFEKIDKDKTGILETPQLRAAFEPMIAHAKKTFKEQKAIYEIGNAVRQKAEYIRDVEAQTKDLEKEEENLVHVRNTQPVKVQLGRLLVKNQMKISDVLIKWDTRNDGEIGRGDFRKHSRALGVVASTEDLDACFDSIDADGGGSLDVDELRVAFKELAAQAKAAQGAEAELERRIVFKRKDVRMAQLELTATVSTELRKIMEGERAQKEAAAAAAAAAAAETKVRSRSPARLAVEAEGTNEVAAVGVPDVSDSSLPPRAAALTLQPPSDD